MRIAVIGGGPAGLYFAILTKRDLPEARVTVVERSRADDTFGFGVVFSDQTLDAFRDADPPSYRAITDSFAYWDDVEVHFRGAVHRIGGNGFCGCARRTLLLRLQERARALGVEMDVPAGGGAGGFSRGRPDRGRGRHQLARPGTLARPLRSRGGFAAQPLRVDGQHPALRRLHLLLPRASGGHLRRPLLPVRSRRQHLGAGGRSRDLRPRRPGRDGRGRVGAVHGGGVPGGAGGPPAARQPLALAALPDHPLRALDQGQCGPARRRQGHRAFLHRLRHQARHGGCDRVARGFRGRRERARVPRPLRGGAARGRGADAARGRRVAGLVRAAPPLPALPPDALRFRADDQGQGDHLGQPGAARPGLRPAGWRGVRGGGARARHPRRPGAPACVPSPSGYGGWRWRTGSWFLRCASTARRRGCRAISTWCTTARAAWAARGCCSRR